MPLNKAHFWRAIDKLPPERHFRAIVGSQLYELTRGYFLRGKELTHWGFRSHLPLGDVFDEMFEVTPSEQAEESRNRLVEIATDVCQGAYWNKYLDDERARELNRRLETAEVTGKQWELGQTFLRRRIAKLMEEHSSEYVRRYRGVVVHMLEARDVEMSMRRGPRTNSPSRVSAEISERESLVTKSLRKIGFKALSTRVGGTYVGDGASSRWQLQFQLDRVKLNCELPIETSGYRQIGVLDLMFGMVRSAPARQARSSLVNSQILLRFDQFFPISRYPIVDVLSTFRSLDELDLILEAKLKMFSALRGQHH